ncbi:hypothetical protein [Kribbella sp. NBC_00889]|uniref:hypothetical protein n=1 Tax=Kribbella sp. NBC_00889 TaxID=2975974 RepID=UPI0038658195|nr:hypothetical protein OG817_22075 [Kribbella sp. NBC_00889]
MARRRREVETTEYLAMVRRLLRTAAKRVGNADEVELAELVALREDLERAITEAVTIQRGQWGRSWAEIGRGLGTTRQAAQQHYGKESA